MSGPIHNIVKKSLNPFIGVGAVCMLCSGIWFITAGQWYALWPASMAFIFYAIIFPLLMIPAGFSAGLMMATKTMYPRASLVFSVLGFVWFFTLMAGYTTLSFSFVRGYINIDAELAIPAVIWAIAASVTPWAFFATRDRDSIFFTGLIYMTALVAAVLFPLSLAYGLSMAQVFWLFWLTLGMMVGLQALCEKYLYKSPVQTEPPANGNAPAETTKPE